MNENAAGSFIDHKYFDGMLIEFVLLVSHDEQILSNEINTYAIK
jgi:hypothetical protein